MRWRRHTASFTEENPRSTALREVMRRTTLRWSSKGYWITWSARPTTDCGIVSPSALPVLRLITSSNFVGCSTGRSAGLAPLRILST